MPVPRVQHALGPRAVVREEQEALRISVKTADGIQALARTDERHDRGATALVARRRDRAGGLVEQDVPMRDGRRRARAVDLERRVRRQPLTDLDSPAAAGDATRGDELLRVTP
jgi:hypothetical protein